MKRGARHNGENHVETTSTGSSSLAPWLGIALIVILFDQLTKIAVQKVFAYGVPHEVTPFFNLVLVYNRGAAFSFLAMAGGWQRWAFTALGVVAALVICYLLKRHGGQKMFCTALSLILGGALGNVIDRLAYGHVIDFLDFHVRDVALAGVQSRRQRDHHRRNPARSRRIAARAPHTLTSLTRGAAVRASCPVCKARRRGCNAPPCRPPPRFVGGFRWQPLNSQENISSSA